jgi:uncharacterized damage-inducible protein DinB
MTPNEARIIADFLLPQIEEEVHATARVIASVPDNRKEYCPHETCTKAGDLAAHLAGADIWFLEGVLNGGFGPQPEASNVSMAELATQYRQKVTELVGKIKKLDGDALAKDVQFFHMTLPTVTYLQFMQKHSVHHRGQLSAYLRPMGAKVPSIYGGSADEPFTAAAAGEGN